MPSKLYLKGDGDPLWLNLSADQVLSAVEEARGSTEFLRLDMVPHTRDEQPMPAYFDADAVAAILPLDPREYGHALDDPPEWLQD